jgi:purine-binding chemotaxis protein CheW
MTEINNLRNDQDGDLRQLVCFLIGDEEFGIDIYRVHDINRMVEITKIPKSPAFIEGIINLRGQIIPVVDLRVRFGMQAVTERSKDSRIIVIEANKATIGFIVDRVTKVNRIAKSSIEPTPEIIESATDNKYIEGVAILENDRLLIVLDADKIFTETETKAIAKMPNTAEALEEKLSAASKKRSKK